MQSLRQVACLLKWPCLLAALLVPSEIGADSDSGAVFVSATIGPFVKVSGFPKDARLSKSSNPGTHDVCVFSNFSGTYTVMGFSKFASDGHFRLKDAKANYVPYAVTWFGKAQPGSGEGLRLKSGVYSNPVGLTNREAVNCGKNGANASFRLKLPQSESAGVSPASYSDTLTFIIRSI